MASEETRLSGFNNPASLHATDAACLVVIHAPVRRLLGARLPLGRRWCCGRDAGCDLVLDAEDVSRRHARVRPEGDGHLLEDLGSTNGTFVGEARAEREQPLQAGDHVRLGSVVLKYLSAATWRRSTTPR